MAGDVDRLEAAPGDEALTVLLTAMNAAEGFPPVPMRELGRRMLAGLDRQGYVLARRVVPPLCYCDGGSAHRH